MNEGSCDSDAFDYALRAFIKCHSRNPDKNAACAPFLADQFMKADGLPHYEREILLEIAHRRLEEWYQRKATNPEYIPNKDDYAHPRSKDGAIIVDTGEPDALA